MTELLTARHLPRDETLISGLRRLRDDQLGQGVKPQDIEISAQRLRRSSELYARTICQLGMRATWECRPDLLVPTSGGANALVTATGMERNIEYVLYGRPEADNQPRLRNCDQIVLEDVVRQNGRLVLISDLVRETGEVTRVADSLAIPSQDCRAICIWDARDHQNDQQAGSGLSLDALVVEPLQLASGMDSDVDAR